MAKPTARRPQLYSKPARINLREFAPGTKRDARQPTPAVYHRGARVR